MRPFLLLALSLGWASCAQTVPPALEAPVSTPTQLGGLLLGEVDPVVAGVRGRVDGDHGSVAVFPTAPLRPDRTFTLALPAVNDLPLDPPPHPWHPTAGGTCANVATVDPPDARVAPLRLNAVNGSGEALHRIGKYTGTLLSRDTPGAETTYEWFFSPGQVRARGESDCEYVAAYPKQGRYVDRLDFDLAPGWTVLWIQREYRNGVSYTTVSNTTRTRFHWVLRDDIGPGLP